MSMNKIYLWFFSIIFIVSGFGSLASSIFMGLLLIILGLFMNPECSKILQSRGIFLTIGQKWLIGIIIFAITIIKVFLYDTRNLDTIQRTVSYMVLGVILLLVSFIYTKYKDKLKEIL